MSSDDFFNQISAASQLFQSTDPDGFDSVIGADYPFPTTSLPFTDEEKAELPIASSNKPKKPFEGKKLRPRYAQFSVEEESLALERQYAEVADRIQNGDAIYGYEKTATDKMGRFIVLLHWIDVIDEKAETPIDLDKKAVEHNRAVADNMRVQGAKLPQM